MSAGDSAAQSARVDPANGSADVDKTDGEPNSKENINEEDNYKASENVECNEASNGKNIEKSEEKVDEKTCVESKEAEEGKKDCQKDDAETTGEENTTAAVYKDNKDVVLREDLRSIFEKFGRVKVWYYAFIVYFYSLCVSLENDMLEFFPLVQPRLLTNR